MNSKQIKKDYRQELTDKVIAQLEAGTAPWIKPWSPANHYRYAFNPTTDKQYNGINQLSLQMEGRADPRWCTYKQAQENGWQVRKGEKGTRIEYWIAYQEVEKLDNNGSIVKDSAGNPVKEKVKLDRPYPVSYVVFNLEQMINAPEYKSEIQKWNPLEQAEIILHNSGAIIEHKYQDNAFYSIKNDTISMPKHNQFNNEIDYYSTVLHELGHWTSHPSRLNRSTTNIFNIKEYAREELRAELASYFISVETGIPHSIKQHADYIGEWIEILKNDKHEIYRAAADADKITNFIIKFNLQQEKIVESDIKINTSLGNSTHQNINYGKAKTDIRINIGKDDLESRQEIMDIKKNNGGVEYSRQFRTWFVHVGQDLNLFSKWLDSKAPALKDTPLYISYHERHKAKDYNAYWDSEKKHYVLPYGSDTVKIPDRYFTQENTKEFIPIKTVEDAAIEFGLLITEPLIADGRIHRVPLDDRPKRKDGAYKLYDDEKGKVIWMQNHVSGEQASYREAKAGMSYTPFSKEELEEKRQKDDQIRKNLQNSTAKKANYLVNKIFTGAVSHPYLDKKNIKAHGVLVNKEGNLIIPLKNISGEIRSFQWITKDGLKGFMKDGEISGNFYSFGNPNNKIIICEGFATGASIYESTKLPVIAAMNASNLEKVAIAIREKYGEKFEIFIAADNDHALVNNPKIGVNRGIIAAQKAAEAVGGSVIIPQLTKTEITQNYTDFNDIAASRGKLEVASQIKTAMISEKHKGLSSKEIEV